MSLATHIATRYVVPLREGGSLPALLETEDGSLFVAKFRGAGQGARALIAELIVGGLAQRLGLPMPDLALLHLDAGFGRTERDAEIQDLLRASHGLNVGLRYLEGALNYNPVADAGLLTPETAAAIVWLDAFTTNIDRTPRNPNLMVWHEAVYLIDHGAALYFHHDWPSVDEARMRTPFPMIRQHVLLPFAGDLAAAHDRLAPQLGEHMFTDLLATVPEALLMDAPEGQAPPFERAEANRAAYVRYLTTRLAGAEAFVEEALRAQAQARTETPEALRYRR